LINIYGFKTTTIAANVDHTVTITTIGAGKGNRYIDGKKYAVNQGPDSEGLTFKGQGYWELEARHYIGNVQ